MEKVLNNNVVEEILSYRLPITDDYQKCSYILPNGKFLKLDDHYEAHRFLVLESLAACPSDAEQILSDLGYIRYSWIGYITLANKEPTVKQYEALEYVLNNVSIYRDEISLQIQDKPKFYLMLSLSNKKYIIDKIKYYYQTGLII